MVSCKIRQEEDNEDTQRPLKHGGQQGKNKRHKCFLKYLKLKPTGVSMGRVTISFFSDSKPDGHVWTPCGHSRSHHDALTLPETVGKRSSVYWYLLEIDGGRFPTLKWYFQVLLKERENLSYRENKPTELAFFTCRIWDPLSRKSPIFTYKLNSAFDSLERKSVSHQAPETRVERQVAISALWRIALPSQWCK